MLLVFSTAAIAADRNLVVGPETEHGIPYLSINIGKKIIPFKLATGDNSSRNNILRGER